ncbi:hypothetical protein DCPSUM001_33310 [Dysgonomonas capnocytophagoides]|nr:hypothetical protein DCPSUM001_33310 [Dysgonomonas capnocytophagoides]
MLNLRDKLSMTDFNKQHKAMTNTINSVPKFFIPHSSSETEARDVYKSIKGFLNSQGRVQQDDKIYSVQYWHNGVLYTDTVGQKSGLEPDEDVIAIFRVSDNLYYICTYSRGVARGEPIMCNPVFAVPFAD